MRIKGDSGTSVSLSIEPDGQIRVLVVGNAMAYSIVNYAELRDAVNNLPPEDAEPPAEPAQAPAPEPTASEEPAPKESPAEDKPAKPKRAVRAKRPSGVLNPKPEDV